MKILNNKKGVIPLFFLVLALFVGLGIAILAVSLMAPDIDFVGETSLTVLASHELQENSFDYLDHSVRFSYLSAYERLKDENMLKLEKFEKHECGEVGYPVFGRDCTPDYEANFLSYFEMEFNKIVRQSYYQSIANAYFTFSLDDNSIRVVSEDLIMTPIRKSVEEVYRSPSGYNLIPGRGTIYQTSVEGFNPSPEHFQRLGLLSKPRISHKVSKIIIYQHDLEALELFNYLQFEGVSYHYFIDKEGRIFNFVPESMVAYHVTCESDCEYYDETSIAVAIQECTDCETRDNSLRRLLKRISDNYEDLELSVNNILLYNEVDSRVDIIDLDKQGVLS